MSSLTVVVDDVVVLKPFLEVTDGDDEREGCTELDGLLNWGFLYFLGMKSQKKGEHFEPYSLW